MPSLMAEIVADHADGVGAALDKGASGAAYNIPGDGIERPNRAVTEAILEHLRAVFPDDAYLAEESGGSGRDAERVWVIDPLDGTVNFAYRIPISAVSVAAVDTGVPSAVR